MSVENPTGGTPTPNQPAGNGSTANEPSISIEDLTAKVAEQLLPRLSQEITGASKRHTASLKEEIQAMLKGNDGASKPADDQKVSPEKVKNTELNDRLKKIEAESARYKARAIRGAVSEAVASAKVTTSARQLLIDTISATAREDDQGNLYMGDADNPVALKDYLANYLKGKDDLLEASARAGSGAGVDKGGSFGPGNMPKTQADLMWATGTDAAGRPVVERTPAAMSAFIAEHGEEAFRKLPVGARPPGREKL